MKRSGAAPAALLVLSLFAVLLVRSQLGLVLAAGLGLGLLFAEARVALALLLLTLSWDQAATFRLGDAFTLRIGQLAAGALFVRLLATHHREGQRWLLPLRPLQALLPLACVAVLAAAGSRNPAKTLGYLAWAGFDVLCVFVLVVRLAREPGGWERLVRLWIWGAVGAAAFGLCQLGLGLAGRQVPFSVQRLGEFPRINGFNYEPAYFALYLESVAAVLLLRAVHRRGHARDGAIALGLLGTAALSMSRSGWLGATLLLATAGVGLLLRGRLVLLVRSGAALLLVALFAAMALPSTFVAQAPRMAAMALDRTEASSTAPRLGSLVLAARVFKESPLVGVGPGGYGGFVLSHPTLRNDAPTQDAGSLVTTNLWMETAAELGLAGVLALLGFLGVMVVSLFRALLAAPPAGRGWLLGLLTSVLLVFGVLYQFNQTLWRLDVWVLLALSWAAVERTARGGWEGSMESHEASTSAEAGPSGRSPVAPHSPLLAPLPLRAVATVVVPALLMGLLGLEVGRKLLTLQYARTLLRVDVEAGEGPVLRSEEVISLAQSRTFLAQALEAKAPGSAEALRRRGVQLYCSPVGAEADGVYSLTAQGREAEDTVKAVDAVADALVALSARRSESVRLPAATGWAGEFAELGRRVAETDPHVRHHFRGAWSHREATRIDGPESGLEEGRTLAPALFGVGLGAALGLAFALRRRSA